MEINGIIVSEFLKLEILYKNTLEKLSI